MLKSWYSSNLCTHHGDMMKILTLAALIPPLMAEVEWSFSLMKLICTRLRCSRTSEHLSACMRISKFRELIDEDFQEILKQWLQAKDTKLKEQRVASCLHWIDTRIYVYVTVVYFFSLISYCCLLTVKDVKKSCKHFFKMCHYYF